MTDAANRTGGDFGPPQF